MSVINPRNLTLEFLYPDPYGSGEMGEDFVEISDFENAVLTLDRNGGYTELALKFVRPFQDWQQMNTYARAAHFYFDGELIFEGRIRTPDSDADSGEMSVVLEGRVALLKRIYESIKITADGEYASYFADDRIDIGNIVKILYEEFIKDSGGGAMEVPPGFAHGVGDSQIDMTNVYRDSFEWDGSGSLHEILESLAEEAGSVFWGFLEPYRFSPHKFGVKGYFYWKRIESSAGYTYRRRVDPDGPYISHCKIGYDFGWAPNEIRIRGGALTTGGRFRYEKRNAEGAGYGIRRIYAPDIRSVAAAEALCDRIYAQYEEIGARLSFTVVNLAEFLRPWKPIRAVDVTSLTIGVVPSVQIQYTCDEILEAQVEGGDASQVNHSPIQVIKEIAKEEIEKAERPPYIANTSVLYQQVSVAIGLPVSQNPDGTFQVELTEPDGVTSLGIVLDSVPVLPGHSDALQTNKPVKLSKVFNANDDATAQWYIENGLYVAT